MLDSRYALTPWALSDQLPETMSHLLLGFVVVREVWHSVLHERQHMESMSDHDYKLIYMVNNTVNATKGCKRHVDSRPVWQCGE